MRRVVAASLGMAVAAIGTTASAYCPSYGTTAGCAVEPAPGSNPPDATLRTFFDKIGTGTFTADEGPLLATMKSGCAAPSPVTTAPTRFPCHVLYAIAQQESAWTQFCVPETPSSAVGKPERTIVSFDCGYGIAQVTSGMHRGDAADFDQARVAADVLYNMAVGAGILRDKWQLVQCVGDRNPIIVEDWYSALWAYNGLAYQNNPNNPTFAAGRKAYDPQNGGAYPYQEKILGWMEHPKGSRWAAIAPAYPNRGEVGTTGTPRALSEPRCASPTNCTQSRSTNLSACSPPPAPDAGTPPDAGPPPPPPEPDAGEVAEEAAPEDDDSGCACAVVGRGSRAAHDAGAGMDLGLGLMFGVAALARRRRSR